LQKKRPSGPSDANISVIRGEYEMTRVINLRHRRLWGAQSHRNRRRKFWFWR
jgi:hypothetical protein